MIHYTQLTKRTHRGKKGKIYSARVYDDTVGKRGWRSTGQETLREAKRVVEAWRNGEEEENLSSSHGITFGRAAKAWLDTKKSRASVACLRVYRSYVSSWTGAFNCGLGRVTSTRIERYFAKRANELSGRSMNNERVQLRSLFKYAVDQGWTDSNPMKTVAKFREERRAIRVMTQKQEERFLKVAETSGGGLYPFVLCMVRSGLRRGTVSKLEWGHVDFSQGTWDIPAGIMKSREAFAERPIADDLLEVLRGLRKPAGKIFGPFDSKRFTAAAKAAGVPWLTPHDLRRHWLTLCRRAHVALETAMWLGDWRDIKTVLTHYRLVDETEGREATRAMLSKLGGQSSLGGSSTL